MSVASSGMCTIAGRLSKWTEDNAGHFFCVTVLWIVSSPALIQEKKKGVTLAVLICFMWRKNTHTHTPMECKAFFTGSSFSVSSMGGTISEVKYQNKNLFNVIGTW